MTPLRHIPLEGGSNLRDVGGYPTADGRRVRWNILYRSGALSRLSERDWQWLAEREISVVCDLRSDQERELAPTVWRGGDRTEHVGIVYQAELIFAPLMVANAQVNVNEMANSHYTLFPRLLGPSFRAMFAALLEGRSPLIVHCSAGQDRTGLAVGLLLGALGVSQDLILEDYQLSTGLRCVENEIDVRRIANLSDSNLVARFYANRMKERGGAALQPRPLVNSQGKALLLDAFAAIIAEWGSIDAYLEQEVGIDQGKIGRLRHICLEPDTSRP